MILATPILPKGNEKVALAKHREGCVCICVSVSSPRIGDPGRIESPHYLGQSGKNRTHPRQEKKISTLCYVLRTPYELHLVVKQMLRPSIPSGLHSIPFHPSLMGELTTKAWKLIGCAVAVRKPLTSSMEVITEFVRSTE